MDLREFAQAKVEMVKEASKASMLVHKGKRAVKALFGMTKKRLNKRIGESAGDLSDAAQKRLSRVRPSHLRKAETEQHKARVHAAVAGGGALAGAGAGAGLAAALKKKQEKKES